jgi:Na+-driven multidrug efflux pump
VAYLFTKVLDLQINGVCYAILIGETSLTLTAMAIFRRGKWKLKQV